MDGLQRNSDKAGQRQEQAAAQDMLGGEGGGGEDVQPEVRKNFADTAFWSAKLLTGADGTSDVELTMPQSLTTWKARVWAMASGTRVGEGAVEIITHKDLLVRLQSPRFFVQTDEVVISANIHNYLKHDKKVKAILDLGGKVLVDARRGQSSRPAHRHG